MSITSDAPWLQQPAVLFTQCAKVERQEQKSASNTIQFQDLNRSEEISIYDSLNSGFLRLWLQLLGDVPLILPSQRHILGVATSCHNLVTLVDEADRRVR